ncbi:hypothetical protein GPECTOR_29g96 [Gonium pectorale]|uniref:Uncharacterized protein n=1 Tax=Gonium pectorale TaxID=33097 RepID=A0A150GER0_GONPE|nr:hypothetical protein GPECTOR_29g96 [Gonium pectorale]|eukprot:KXZ48322.1 hypothetical protein GPECTOR_29g96 [Gonium pectorale]
MSRTRTAAGSTASLAIRTTIASVALLCTLWWPAGVRGECRLSLQLDAQETTLSLYASAALSNPLLTNAPLGAFATFDEGVPAGVSGSILAVNPELSSCPPASDRAAWLNSMAGFSLTSAPAQPLETFPTKHVGHTDMAALAKPPRWDFNLTGLSLTLASTGPISVSYSYDSADGGDSWDYTVSWRSSWASGGRTALVFEVPQLSITYQAAMAEPFEFYGLGYNGTANFTVNAYLVAKAWLDCPSSCGPGGRCGGSAGCVCECGWAAPPAPSPGSSTTTGPNPSAPNGGAAGFRITLAIEGLDPAALDASAAGKDALAAAVAAVASSSAPSQGALVGRVLSVASLPSADGGAAVVALRLLVPSPNGGAGAKATDPSPAAAQSAFDSLQSATLSLGLQRALRGGRSGLLAKAKVRAISGQLPAAASTTTTTVTAATQQRRRRSMRGVAGL